MAVPPSAMGLAGLLGGVGVTHFAMPAVYDAMIPAVLPGSPRAWTYGSGAFELVVAAGLLAPPTRARAALAAAGLFAGILPANLKMAVDARRSKSTAYRVGTMLRLPLQVPLIAWALRVRRAAG